MENRQYAVGNWQLVRCHAQPIEKSRHCEERGTSNVAISSHWLEIASLNPLAMTAPRVCHAEPVEACGAGSPPAAPFDRLRVTARFARRLLCVLFAVHCSLLTVFAQYVSNGTEPARTRWSHIGSAHFDVIFPDSILAQGTHFTRLLSKVYAPVSASLNYQPRRIPVILHPYNLRSNGMVVWTPSRMEVIATAPSTGYAQPWLEQLALHELRHVVQTDMMNRGFTRALYYLLGEQAVALPSALIKPWLFEGDAVATETAMSRTGRGRMASFSMGLRTIALSSPKKYSYDKYLLGSYKDYIPNHYEYGYHLVAYGRHRYGADLWAKIFRYTGSYPFLLFPQSIATKKYTGKNPKALHEEAKAFVDSLWQAQQPQKIDKATPLVKEKNSRRKQFVSYETLAALPNGEVMAERQTLTRTSMLVRILPDGSEKKVAMLGSLSSSLQRGGSNVYWTEYSPDLRWEQRNYSELWRYNAKRGRKQRLTHRTSYFSPAVSENMQVAVCEKLMSGEQAIILLDSNFQKLREVARLELGESVHSLAWLDNEHLAVLHIAAQGMSIDLVNVGTKKMETLLPYTHANISGLFAQGEKIFFSSDYSGIDNIYALDVRSKTVHKLTASAYGAGSARLSSKGQQLLYADYSLRGAKPVALSVDSLLWQKTSFDTPYTFPLAEAIARQENFVLDTATLDTAPLAARRYRKFAHLLRLHSWTPFSFSSSELMAGDFSSLAVGATLLSQNNLSSMVSSLGYKYQHGFSSVNASIAYRGWFPVVELSANYGTRRAQTDRETLIGSTRSDLYGELNLSTYLPLNFSRGNIQKTFTPYFQLQFSNDWQLREVEGKPHEIRVCSANLGFSAQVSTRMVQRDINPRWGLSLSANVQSTFNKWNQKTSVSGQVFAPGLLPNHSLRLYAGYEEQQLPLLYATRLAKPRGFVLGGIAAPYLLSLSTSYALPLCYPDLSLGFLAYIKRIRFNVFADYLRAYDVSNFSGKKLPIATFGSAGYEAVFDFHAFRFPVLFSAGWRHSFTLSKGSVRPEKLPIELLLSFSY
ncbi:MAG: hypothetical protein LBU92_04765 [Prevotellaceae bacterium]|nr:hypothetical protein [Prevotellaceae bacterium]